MSSRKSVQNTHIRETVRSVHQSLLDIIGVMNSPQRDDAMIKEAGIALDRALFPLIVVIERFGPIGVVELADRVGRDHTTVSRQITRLEELGLVERRQSVADRRVRAVSVTAPGQAMIERVDAARERISRPIMETWDPRDVDDLVRLLRRLADMYLAAPPAAQPAREESSPQTPPRG